MLWNFFFFCLLPGFFAFGGTNYQLATFKWPVWVDNSRALVGCLAKGFFLLPSLVDHFDCFPRFAFSFKCKKICDCVVGWLPRTPCFAAVSTFASCSGRFDSSSRFIHFDNRPLSLSLLFSRLLNNAIRAPPLVLHRSRHSWPDPTFTFAHTFTLWLLSCFFYLSFLSSSWFPFFPAYPTYLTRPISFVSQQATLIFSYFHNEHAGAPNRAQLNVYYSFRSKIVAILFSIAKFTLLGFYPIIFFLFFFLFFFFFNSLDDQYRAKFPSHYALALANVTCHLFVSSTSRQWRDSTRTVK